MMRVRWAIAVAAVVPLIWSAPAQSAGQTPAGLWQALDSDTEPTGWLLISDHNGVYDGIIAKMFLKPGEDPNAICDRCKDDRHDHTWLGLEIIRGMKPEGEDKFGGGTILDPRDGKIYRATMKLTPDGQTLVVRGYIGFELLGQNQYWTRLPDSAYTILDPGVNPQYIQKVAPAPAPAKTPRKTDVAPPAKKTDAPLQLRSTVGQ
jgi:uncharacterized protein (DUF2147 family)